MISPKSPKYKTFLINVKMSDYTDSQGRLCRDLGECTECGKKLVEICNGGIWCYNYGMPESEQIVHIKGVKLHAKYRCRPCATVNQKKKHDRTF